MTRSLVLTCHKYWQSKQRGFFLPVLQTKSCICKQYLLFLSSASSALRLSLQVVKMQVLWFKRSSMARYIQSLLSLSLSNAEILAIKKKTKTEQKKPYSTIKWYLSCFFNHPIWKMKHSCALWSSEYNDRFILLNNNFFACNYHLLQIKFQKYSYLT